MHGLGHVDSAYFLWLVCISVSVEETLLYEKGLQLKFIMHDGIGI